MKKGHLVEQAVNAIIRPPRRTYDSNSLPLVVDGPNGEQFYRHPVTFTNDRNLKIVGSIYLKKECEITKGWPCLIYLHGNASSQKEGQFLIPNICTHNVALFCFDFTGSGNSDGKYISLGYYETMDLNYLINQLSLTFNMRPFSLWGRSMGAATAVMCTHPLVKCKIVDSAYTSIPDVCKAIAMSLKMPEIFCPAALWFLKLKISDIANFDISTVSALEIAKKTSQPPLLMCHASDDEFVPFEEGVEIFNHYSNPDKTFVKAKEGHNGPRGPGWINQACLFALKHLGVFVDQNKYSTMHQTRTKETAEHFRSYDDLVKFAREHPKEDVERDSSLLLTEVNENGEDSPMISGITEDNNYNDINENNNNENNNNENNNNENNNNELNNNENNNNENNNNENNNNENNNNENNNNENNNNENNNNENNNNENNNNENENRIVLKKK